MSISQSYLRIQVKIFYIQVESAEFIQENK